MLGMVSAFFWRALFIFIYLLLYFMNATVMVLGMVLKTQAFIIVTLMILRAVSYLFDEEEFLMQWLLTMIVLHANDTSDYAKQVAMPKFVDRAENGQHSVSYRSFQTTSNFTLCSFLPPSHLTLHLTPTQ